MSADLSHDLTDGQSEAASESHDKLDNQSGHDDQEEDHGLGDEELADENANQDDCEVGWCVNRTGHESPFHAMVVKNMKKRLGVFALLIEVNIAKIKMTRSFVGLMATT